MWLIRKLFGFRAVTRRKPRLTSDEEPWLFWYERRKRT